MKKILMIIVVILLGAYLMYTDYMQTSSSVEAPVEGNYQQEVLTTSNQDKALERSFNYFMPSKLVENPALVFVLHGSNASGDKIRFQSGYQYDYLANQTGEFIVVYPNGYQNHWNDCRASASYAANKENIDDPAFFNQMIDYFKTGHQIDENRVFAVGFSNGAQMVYRLGLETPEHFAGLAAIAANLPIAENSDCSPTNQPVSMAVFNGTLDPINPYEGGLVDVFGDTSRGSVLSTEQTMQYWADISLMTKKLKATLPDTDNNNATSIIKTVWQGTDSHNVSKEVRLYTLKGSGHVMPSKVVDFAGILGGKAQDIEAAEEIWSFFKSSTNTNRTN